MSDPRHAYDDIREVRNVGRRRANSLLAHGWVLLDWQTEQSIERRDVARPDGESGETMYFKTQSIQYIVGRPEDVYFTSDDLAAFEREEADRRRAARERERDERLASLGARAAEEAKAAGDPVARAPEAES